MRMVAKFWSSLFPVAPTNIICIDNGYELASELNITPSVVIGDLDSVDISKVNQSVIIIKEEDQNTNDLEKALNYCLSKNIRDIIFTQTVIESFF